VTTIFNPQARELFAQNYPETPHKLAHGLRDHPLLTLESLAKLSERLPFASVEYNKGDLTPIATSPMAFPSAIRSAMWTPVAAGPY
jgi:hypothetical protein